MINYIADWTINFSITLIILLLLSRDIYFNPKIRWCLLLSTAIGIQAVISTWLRLLTHDLFIAFELPQIASISPMVVPVVMTGFWILFDIWAFF